MVENFDKMLAGSLRPEDPWYIIGAEFNEEEPAIHIHVGIDKTAALCCPVCGAPTKRYGYEPKERIRRHADCLFYPCYVHCKTVHGAARTHDRQATDNGSGTFQAVQEDGTCLSDCPVSG